MRYLVVRTSRQSHLVDGQATVVDVRRVMRRCATRAQAEVTARRYRVNAWSNETFSIEPLRESEDDPFDDGRSLW